MILIDGSGEVVLMNRAAAKIVRSGDALTTRGRRLVAQDSETNRKLATLIARALKTSHGAASDSAGGIAVPRPSGRFDVIVIPLGIDRGPDCAHVAVLICDPQSNDGQKRLLSALYGLTEAESRIATTIATGAGVPVVAARLGLTANTVRTHLKQVFAKTGTRRQAELAGLLRSTRIAGN